MAPKNKLTIDDEMARIEEALLALPARTRAIFLMHCLDGLGYAAIAERYGISEARVGQHIAAAMMAIDCAVGRRRPWWRRFLDRWR